MLRRLFTVLVSTLILAGCYYENLGTERQYVGGNSETRQQDFNQCRQNTATGCITGHVPSAPDIFVNGVQFEDVYDLKDRFLSLVQFKDEEGVALRADQVALDLITRLDNRSFARGFQAYLKGEETRNVDVLSNGLFQFHNLTPGNYDLRILKRLQFAASRTDLDSDQDPQLRVLCATLAAESSLSVYRGEPQRIVIDDYRLYWRDRDCGDGADVAGGPAASRRATL